MIRVNLLTANLSATHEQGPSRHRSAFAGVLLLLVTVALVGLWWRQVGREATEFDARIARGEADLARLRHTAKLAERATARKADLSGKLALIERLRAAQHAPVNLLAAVSRSAPDGLWLMEIDQRGAMVQLDGRATSLTAVTDFVERLQSSGLFDRPVESVATSMEPVDETAVVRFVVKAQAAGTYAAAAASRNTRKGG